MKKPRRLLWLLLLVPVLGAVPGYSFLCRPSRILDNERAASTALKTLTSAEADFRANDRDWNHVNDFWTGDVAGLYYVRPNAAKDAPELRLILREIAEADVQALKPLTPKPVAYRGYYFIALEEDDNFDGVPERFYKVDTGGTPPMGKVHNTSQFGFCAYPEKYGVTGKFTFIVNENNTILRRDIGGKPMTHFPKSEPIATQAYSTCPD